MLLTTVSLVALLSTTAGAETLKNVQLVDSGSTSGRRWMDVADNLYGESYQGSYNYTQATVSIDYFTDAVTLHGTLTATNLKPNFAYQLKLIGSPSDPDGNEQIGLTGRWWQTKWIDGTGWTNGQNLNNKGDGSSPNPNDLVYFQQRDIPDPTSPTGKKYSYDAYLVFDYFVTDENGDAAFEFEADDSYHVLWKTLQRTPVAGDGPIINKTFAVTLPDPVGAYDTSYPETTVGVYGEWERLPPGEILLPFGDYAASFNLTEESFHGSDLAAGSWASAMSAMVTFTIVPEPASSALLISGALLMLLMLVCTVFGRKRGLWGQAGIRY